MSDKSDKTDIWRLLHCDAEFDTALVGRPKEAIIEVAKESMRTSLSQVADWRHWERYKASVARGLTAHKLDKIRDSFQNVTPGLSDDQLELAFREAVESLAPTAPYPPTSASTQTPSILSLISDPAAQMQDRGTSASPLSTISYPPPRKSTLVPDGPHSLSAQQRDEQVSRPSQSGGHDPTGITGTKRNIELWVQGVPQEPTREPSPLKTHSRNEEADSAASGPSDRRASPTEMAERFASRFQRQR